MKNNTQTTCINNSVFFSIFNKPIANKIGDIGTTSLSDALKSNITLTRLELRGEYKRNNTQMKPIKQSTLFYSHQSTDNFIGDTGATSISDALKTNTTLTELSLTCRYKRNNTEMASINNPLFSILVKTTVNEFRETGATSLSDALKINTTLTELTLHCKCK